MTDAAAREAREGRKVRTRLRQLFETPIPGRFDTAHLKAIHAHLFQDFPHHRPGITREDTDESWMKNRFLENRTAHRVYYAYQDVEARIDAILRGFGGPGAIANLGLDEAAARLARLYADLDHAHGFYEGNSRTLREFTRALADAAGLTLDWTKAVDRDALYIARDVAVMERAFPGLTEARAMETNDRTEYEAFFVLERLRTAMGERSLERIIRDAL